LAGNIVVRRHGKKEDAERRKKTGRSLWQSLAVQVVGFFVKGVGELIIYKEVRRRYEHAVYD
jgi:hypothetical protein